MNVALHKIREAEFIGFSVSTCLFSTHMETRVFSDNEEIPLKIVKSIREMVTTRTFLAPVHVMAEAGWDMYLDEPSETEFFGIAVTSGAFLDAIDVHDATCDIVREFIAAHKRVVTYEEH